MEKVTIKNINKKLGFNYADYEVPDTGLLIDDTESSPLDILTTSELKCLSAFNAKSFGWDYSKYGFSDEDLEP